MYIDPTIFRAYDIRGTYPDAVSEKIFFYLGQAISQMVKGLVVVGYDARISSPSLYNAVIRGLSYSGGRRIKIVPVGMITTPELYFLVNKLGAGAGIAVTASHNPAHENGLKLVGKRAVPIFTEELKKFIESQGEFAPSPVLAKIIRPEPNEHYHQLYAQFLLKQLKLKRPLKIVLDCSDGTVGLVLKTIKAQCAEKNIPLTLTVLNGEPNGKFPAHGTSPLAKGALDELARAVVTGKADLGVIFDSDGDRILFVDEHGQQIPPDAVFVLLAENFSGSVVIDPRVGFLGRGYLESHKRKAIISRVGHAFIKKALRESGSAFGGELSGHYYFKDFFSADSGLFTLMQVLSSVSRLQKPITEWLAEFPPYYRSGEINFVLKNTAAKDKTLAAIEKRYLNEAVNTDKLDGLKMEFTDSWLLVRPSGNEDMVRLYVEAKSEKAMKGLVKELTAIIKRTM